MSTFIVYTDGACNPNPGRGGWAAVIRSPDGVVRELSGVEGNTTNNRMEMLSCLMAIAVIPERSVIQVWTDSQYVQKGMTLWIQNWKKRNWFGKSKHGSLAQPVKNRDLWESLDQLSERRFIKWSWCRGHSGNPLNERCDELAENAANSDLAKFAHKLSVDRMAK